MVRLEFIRSEKFPVNIDYLRVVKRKSLRAFTTTGMIYFLGNDGSIFLNIDLDYKDEDQQKIHSKSKTLSNGNTIYSYELHPVHQIRFKNINTYFTVYSSNFNMHFCINEDGKVLVIEDNKVKMIDTNLNSNNHVYTHVSNETLFSIETDHNDNVFLLEGNNINIYSKDFETLIFSVNYIGNFYSPSICFYRGNLFISDMDTIYVYKVVY